MNFICPQFANMPDDMLQFSRLYAYPAPPSDPPDDGLVILDSGAFGLSQRGSQIGERHMRQLAEYYAPYAGRSGYYCIAPDVFLDPHQTMRNWQWWQAHVGLPVVPVIQFTKLKYLDLYAAAKQARFYADSQPEFVAISNPGLRCAESGGIETACQIARLAGAKWLHCLGAGWNPVDIIAWRKRRCFDSIDTIAYYTDAQDGWFWRSDGSRERSKLPWRKIAVHNARVAVEIA